MRKLTLGIFQIIFELAGYIILFIHHWAIALGVFLVIWGNNFAHYNTHHYNEEEDEEYENDDD